jgi:DNA topoisomerase-1
VQQRNDVLKENRDGVERPFRILTLSNDKITDTTKTEITGAEKMKLFPTDIGLLVNDFLIENFKEILDYGFTADIEAQFDEIALGKKEWHKMIDGFYKPFHEAVEVTTKEAKRVSGERLLGEEPGTGEPVIARMGKYGPMAQIGKSDDEAKKARFAKLRPAQSIETITLEEALELFRLPRVVGEFEGKEIKVNVGRFGPYVQHNSKFVSLKKEQDPYTLTLEDAEELIKAKRIAEENAVIQNFEAEGIQILKGRFGPYIKKEKDNYKIPKGTDAELMTLEDVLEIVKAGPQPKKGGFKRGAAKKK